MARQSVLVAWAVNLLMSLALFQASFAAADAVKDLQDKGRTALNTALAKSKTCTKEKLQIRREWYILLLFLKLVHLLRLFSRGDMAKADKAAYIKAVQCIMAAKPKIDTTKVPGAKTRYDDFVAIHIQQTLTIHGTVSYLALTG